MVLIIFLLLIAFLLGALTGAFLLYHVLPARFRQHVDYKERWQAAVGLLGDQGQLSKEQMKTITAPVAVPSAPASTRQTQSGGKRSAQVQIGNATMRTIYSMASWDRKHLEIERARQGLDPVDDLRGMASWDIEKVLEARARFGRK